MDDTDAYIVCRTEDSQASALSLKEELLGFGVRAYVATESVPASSVLARGVALGSCHTVVVFVSANLAGAWVLAVRTQALLLVPQACLSTVNLAQAAYRS